MNLQIAEHAGSVPQFELQCLLSEYAQIPIAFETYLVTEVEALGSERFILHERPLPQPLRKDYDSLPSEHPTNWSCRFDLSRWRLFFARNGGKLVGGAAAVMHSPELAPLEPRADLAVLWDIRVHPHGRRGGVGSALLAAVESWASGCGATCLKAETQNINTLACRFYQRQGFQLLTVNAGAYPTFPDEIQLFWYKTLR